MADKKVSQLPQASSLQGPEYFDVVQSGESRRATVGAARTTPIDDVSGYVVITSSDNARLKRAVGSSDIVLPPNLPVSTRIEILRDTSGVVNLTADVGAEIISMAGPSVNVVAQYGRAVATVVSANRWYISGDIIASNPDTPADVTAPTVPTGVAVGSPTYYSLSVSWTASTDDVGVVGYRIRRGGTVVGTTASSPFVDTGLTPSTGYTYTVSAFDAAGNESAQSSSAGGTTSATPTSNPTVNASVSTNYTNQAGVQSGGVSLAHPTAMADGDTAFIFAGVSRQGGGDITWVPPSGFTELESLNLSGAIHGAVFSKKITSASGEGAWVMDATAADAPTTMSLAAVALCMSEIEDPAGLTSAIAADATNQNNHAAPSVTVDSDGSIVLAGQFGARDGTWTPPSGYTELADLTSANNTSTDRVSVTVAQKDTTVDTGTESPGTFVYSIARGAIGFSVAASPYVPPVAPTGALLYAPPTLTNPTTINVTNSNRGLNLDPNTDYIINMPDYALDVRGGLSIAGGRNIVLIGGEIYFTQDYSDATTSVGKTNRGLYLKDIRGTVHVEGLKIGGDVVGEGIDLSMSYGGIVQLCNLQIDCTTGSQATNHADIVQTWVGPDILRIDGLTGQTPYQGFFLLPTQYAPNEPFGFSTWEFNRVNLIGTNTAAYLYWLADSNQGPCPPVSVSNCWGLPNPNKSTRDQWLWPKDDPKWDPVQQGTPPGGDFVTTAGLNYVSPGYV